MTLHEFICGMYDDAFDDVDEYSDNERLFVKRLREKFDGDASDGENEGLRTYDVDTRLGNILTERLMGVFNTSAYIDAFDDATCERVVNATIVMMVEFV